MARIRLPKPKPEPTRKATKPPSSSDDEDDEELELPPAPAFQTDIIAEALNYRRIFDEIIQFDKARGEEGKQGLRELLSKIIHHLAGEHLACKPFSYEEPYPRPYSQYRTPSRNPPAISQGTSMHHDQPPQVPISSEFTSSANSTAFSNPRKRKAGNQQSGELTRGKKSKVYGDVFRAKPEKHIYILRGIENPTRRMGTEGQTPFIKLSKGILAKNSKLVAQLIRLPSSPENDLIFVPTSARPFGHPIDGDTIYLPDLLRSHHITGHAKFNNVARRMVASESQFWSALKKWLNYVHHYGLGVEGQNGGFTFDAREAPLEDVLLVAELFGGAVKTDLLMSIGLRDADAALDPIIDRL